jgi:Protein of unknown function (DUF3052)
VAQQAQRQRQPERDYSHRSTVDKLGIKPGHVVAFEAAPVAIPEDLRHQALERSGRDAAAESEVVDVVLVGADDSTDFQAVLTAWRARIDPAGGIWLLTPKRGQPGYVDQRELIATGPDAGLVDNKICSIDDHTSAMRFVIRKIDRVYS